MESETDGDKEISKCLPIPIICDPSTIVALAREVSQSIKRNFVVLLQEDLDAAKSPTFHKGVPTNVSYVQLPNADAQVRLVEPIGYVPA